MWPRSLLRLQLLIALVALLGSAPVLSEPLVFTSTFNLKAFGAADPLGRPGPSWNGVGIGVSSTAPNAIGFLTLTHGTGPRTTTFMGIQATAGFPISDTLFATLSSIGSPDFSGTPLVGLMPVRGWLTGQIAMHTPAGQVGLGVGGTAPFTFISPTGGTLLTGSIQFAPWTTGSPPLTGVAKQLTSAGFVFPTIVSTITLGGFDARTPGGLGQVQLVSPVQIFIGAGKTGGYGVLSLDFVPEPSRLLGFGAGAVSLLLLGTRKRRTTR
jgi:hypothetical protein